MSVSNSLIDRILREIQAELRTVRTENGLIRKDLSAKAGREELLAVLAALSDRIGQFEARLETRMDQTERSIDERLGRIETLLRHER
jgi:hypothetical protein